ncbi:MAG: hypothetical protein O7G84_01120 [Gammaproteobacteria bacterium]|nr:hypothetical protein [Gammaproteobacteria bacterium]
MEIIDLVRGLRAVALATGGKQFPDMLIDVVDGELHFVATDGCWLIEWQHDVGRSTEDARVGVCGLSLAAAIPTLIQFAEGQETQGDLLLGDGAAFVEDGVKPIRIEHGLGAVTINGAALSGLTFADKYEALMRPARHPAPAPYFAGTAGYLTKVAEAFKIVGGRADPNLLLRVGGAMDPIHVTCPDLPELTAILMPVRLSDRSPKS